MENMDSAIFICQIKFQKIPHSLLLFTGGGGLDWINIHFPELPLSSANSDSRFTISIIVGVVFIVRKKSPASKKLVTTANC